MICVSVVTALKLFACTLFCLQAEKAITEYWNAVKDFWPAVNNKKRLSQAACAAIRTARNTCLSSLGLCSGERVTGVMLPISSSVMGSTAFVSAKRRAESLAGDLETERFVFSREDITGYHRTQVCVCVCVCMHLSPFLALSH